jgi:hypothetical protein
VQDEAVHVAAGIQVITHHVAEVVDALGRGRVMRRPGHIQRGEHPVPQHKTLAERAARAVEEGPHDDTFRVDVERAGRHGGGDGRPAAARGGTRALAAATPVTAAAIADATHVMIQIRLTGDHLGSVGA